MEIETWQAGRGRSGLNFSGGSATPVAVSRGKLIEALVKIADGAHLPAAMRALTDYVGAANFLLTRYDLVQEQGLDFVVTSDWPFDLVRRLSAELANVYARTTEFEKCMLLLQPKFLMLPDEAELPAGIGRQYCALTFNVGRARFAVMLLFAEGAILSHERLREIGLLAGYYSSFSRERDVRSDRDFELTDRELECLYWIAEGKTSDEIAVILGISRNTINNYITSVMRKTATKTRSEAIAYAVRNNLV